VLARRRGQDDDEADLLGTAVIAAVVFLLPVVSYFTSIVAGITGALVGLLAGLLLSRLKPR
jgi:hypothetical protein